MNNVIADLQDHILSCTTAACPHHLNIAEVIMLIRRGTVLRFAIERAIERLGSPTMAYHPPIELAELRRANIEATRILLDALAQE